MKLKGKLYTIVVIFLLTCLLFTACSSKSHTLTGSEDTSRGASQDTATGDSKYDNLQLTEDGVTPEGVFPIVKEK
mgnify:FL=1